MECAAAQRARVGALLPRALAARQGRSLDPRGQLHGLLLVEDPRQGRHRRVGDAADRLSDERARRPRVRAARLPAGRLVQLVPILADPRALPVRPRRPARALPRGPRPPWRGLRRGLGVDRRGPEQARGVQVGARQGRLRPRELGRRRRPRLGGARLHDQALRARPDRRLLAHPRDVDGLVRGRHPLPVADRRDLHELLRLVRRPAARLAADVGRPDRRAGVGRLVERGLHRALGVEHPADPDAGRALPHRGALSRAEGRRRLA